MNFAARLECTAVGLRPPHHRRLTDRRGIANKMVNGSVTAALVSIVLAVLFLYWPPTSTVGPPQQHAQNSSGSEGPGAALGTR
jgi:hypothetical protein